MFHSSQVIKAQEEQKLNKIKPKWLENFVVENFMKQYILALIHKGNLNELKITLKQQIQQKTTYELSDEQLLTPINQLCTDITKICCNKLIALLNPQKKPSNNGQVPSAMKKESEAFTYILDEENECFCFEGQLNVYLYSEKNNLSISDELTMITDKFFLLYASFNQEQIEYKQHHLCLAWDRLIKQIELHADTKKVQLKFYSSLNALDRVAREEARKAHKVRYLNFIKQFNNNPAFVASASTLVQQNLAPANLNEALLRLGGQHFKHRYKYLKLTKLAIVGLLLLVSSLITFSYTAFAFLKYNQKRKMRCGHGFFAMTTTRQEQLSQGLRNLDCANLSTVNWIAAP